MPDDPNNPMLAANTAEMPADAEPPYEGHDASAEAVFASPEQQAAAAAASDPTRKYELPIPSKFLTAEEINGAAAKLAEHWNGLTKRERELLRELKSIKAQYAEVHGTMSRLVAVCRENNLPLQQGMIEIAEERTTDGARIAKPKENTE